MHQTLLLKLARLRISSTETVSEARDLGGLNTCFTLGGKDDCLRAARPSFMRSELERWPAGLIQAWIFILTIFSFQGGHLLGASATKADGDHGHSEMVTSLGFSSDGRWLASGSFDGSVKIWRASDGKLWRTLGVHPGQEVKLAMLPEVNRLVSVGEKQIKIWETPEGRLVSEWTNRVGRLTAMSVSPDGETLAVGTSYNSIRLWRTSDGMPLRTWKAHNWDVTSLAFGPNGKILASSDYDGTISLWQPDNGSLVRSAKGHPRAIFCVRFSPDGRYLASAGLDDDIRLWMIPSLRCYGTVRAKSRRVYSLAFSPDGALLASGGWDKKIKLWAIPGLKPKADYLAHQGRVHAVAFSPDGLTLASASSDRRVRLWQVANRSLIFSLGD